MIKSSGSHPSKTTMGGKVFIRQSVPVMPSHAKAQEPASLAVFRNSHPCKNARVGLAEG